MFKKVGIAALIAVIGLGLVSRTEVGRWAWSHIRLASGDVRDGIKSMVSIETEIKRLDKEIDELKNEVAASYKPLAREMVEVEQLKKDIVVAEKDVAARESVVKTARRDLDTVKTQVGVGADAKVEKLSADFTMAWKSFEVAERNLKTKKDVLQRKEELVEQAKDKIKAMVDRQGMLKTKLAGLRTNLEAVRVAQMKSPVKVEDGRLAGIEKDMEAVEARIKEMSTELSLKEKFATGQVTVEDKVERAKAEEEFDARFGKSEDVVRKEK
jgi:chromosome segregation ATPase